jgi:hypothetical protein
MNKPIHPCRRVSTAFAIAALAWMSCLGSASGADWRRVGDTWPEGTNVYLDVDSLSKGTNGHVVADVLFDYELARKNSHGSAHSSEMRRTRFDCKKERLADQIIIQFSERKSRGEVVNRVTRTTAQTDAAMESVETQSLGQALTWAVCELSVRGKPAGQ